MRALGAIFCFGISAITVYAQWQLPPGTSSSVDDGAHAAQEDARTASLRTAEERLHEQDWPAAIRLLRPLAENSADERANYDLGYALDSTEEIAAAKTAYGRAIAADATAVEPRIALGLLLARAGETSEAEQQLTQAIGLPSAADQAVQRAQAYRALARLHLSRAPDQARDELANAVRLTGENAADVSLAAEIAETLHAGPEAEAIFARAWKAAPEDETAAAQYARVLIRDGKLDEARTVLRQAQAAHPDSLRLTAEQAALLLKAQDFAGAVPLLERLHAASPLEEGPGLLLARAYVAGGQVAQAEPLLRSLAMSNTEDGPLAAELGDVLVRLKKYPEAETVLARALGLQFHSPGARAEAAAALAFAASANHDPDAVLRAEEVHDKTLPQDAPGTFLRATAHDTLHHTRQALEAYRQFVELAGQGYPDEVWQAKQRLQVLSRAK